MRSRWAVPTRRRNQRGIALAVFGISMLMLTAFAVVGVDVGRLAFTASEVQSMADAAALAAIGEHAAGTVDPTTKTTTVVGLNTIDGRAGDISDATTAGIKTLTPGIYDFPTKTFTPSTWTDPLTNAAKAVGQGTVTNLLAAAIGVVDSTVTRQGTAAVGGACDEVGAWPMAIELDAVQDFLNAPNCTTVPDTRLFQVPLDNSCFTSLNTGAASAFAEKQHIPTACGPQAGGQTETLNMGDMISLNNGQDASVLQLMKDCLQANVNEFVVPVVPANSCCGGCQQPIVSFARIIVDHVNTTGSNKGVFIKGVCREEVTGSDAGCNTAGENAISLVQ